MMRIGIVGCGFTADHYLLGLKTVSLFWNWQARLTGMRTGPQSFARFTNVETLSLLGEMLADSSIELIVNMTNTSSHYEVSRHV